MYLSIILIAVYRLAISRRPFKLLVLNFSYSNLETFFHRITYLRIFVKDFEQGILIYIEFPFCWQLQCPCFISGITLFDADYPFDGKIAFVVTTVNNRNYQQSKSQCLSCYFRYRQYHHFLHLNDKRFITKVSLVPRSSLLLFWQGFRLMRQYK